MKEINDVLAYVKELLSGGAKVIFAKKFACVIARKGKIGEWVTTWNVDAKGNPIIEKESQAKEDSWIVTKVDENGQPITDLNGNKNEWIVEEKVFHQKYQKDTSNPEIYRPIGGIQKFIKISEAITISHWGGKMNVDAGGYLNITNPNDIYVVSDRDFHDIYKEV